MDSIGYLFQSRNRGSFGFKRMLQVTQHGMFNSRFNLVIEGLLVSSHIGLPPFKPS